MTDRSRCLAHFSGGCQVVALVFSTLMFASTHATAQTAAKPDPDVLTFTNGDQLTGKVVSETGGVVMFQSDMAGKADGSVGRPAPQVPVGTISYSNDEISVSEGAGEVKDVPAKDAAYVVDGTDFQNAMQHEPSYLQGWHGGATVGASLVQATQTSRTFTGAVGLVRTAPDVNWLAPRNKTILDASAAYSSLTQPAVGTTPASSAKTNILHGDVEHDWFLTPRFYALVDASADHNLGSGLKIQQTYGGGAGYAVIRQPVQTLDVKADVHYSRQEFYPAGLGLTGLELNLIGINVGEICMRKLVHGMVFNESALVQPAFNHPSAFTAQFVAGLLFPAYKNFGFSLGMQDNYINNPPTGYKNNTFLFTAGLNYTFK